MRRSAPGLLLTVLLGISMLPGASADSASPKTWQARMRALAATTNELLPQLVSRHPDKAVVLEHAQTLADLAHAVRDDAARKMTRPPGDADASLPILAGQFAEDARAAYAALRGGQFDYGVDLLRSVTSHCLACHTRHEADPGIPRFPLSPKMDALGRVEQADLLTAIRRFEEALAEYQAIAADDKFANAHQIEWERAVRHGLSLAVRVKQSPEAALQIVEDARTQGAAPEFLRQNAARWEAALNKWKAETAAGAGKNPADTEPALYERMKRLFTEAQAAQEYPAYKGANVEYLRASAAAHDLLARFPDSKRAAEALYIAGMAYDVIGDATVWPSHQLYFEACVHRAPHSQMAARCYERFEQAVYLGYSGSGGTFIPEDMVKRMTALKRIAEPIDTRARHRRKPKLN
ncbi:MAG: hypothetical protein ACREVE_09715 [Gammaproteobacteria bacterium]